MAVGRPEGKASVLGPCHGLCRHGGERADVQHRAFFSSWALKASRVPSGESTGGPDKGELVTNYVPLGGRTNERTTGVGRRAS